MFVEDELRQKHVDCLNKITKHASRTVLQLAVSNTATSTHCCTIRLTKGQDYTSADEQWEVSQIKERNCGGHRQRVATDCTCGKRNANRVGLSAATCKTEMEAVI